MKKQVKIKEIEHSPPIIILGEDGLVVGEVETLSCQVKLSKKTQRKISQLFDVIETTEKSVTIKPK